MLVNNYWELIPVDSQYQECIDIKNEQPITVALSLCTNPIVHIPIIQWNYLESTGISFHNYLNEICRIFYDIYKQLQCFSFFISPFSELLFAEILE